MFDYLGLAVSLIAVLLAFVFALRQERPDATGRLLLAGIVACSLVSAYASWVGGRALFDAMIGGDSFCYLEVNSIDDAADTGWLLAVHEGDHPLYDVEARVVNAELYAALRDANPAVPDYVRRARTEKYISLGNMTPGYASTLDDGYGLERDGSVSLNIFFVARNGGFSQLLRYRKVNGHWESAIRVERHFGGGVVLETVSDGYPRNDESGEVDW